MRLTRILSMILPVVIIFIISCASNLSLREIQEENQSLIFGYIEFEDKNQRLKLIEMFPYKSGQMITTWDRLKFKYFENGLFVAENIDPGRYYLATMHIQRGMKSSILTFSVFPKDEDAISIPPSDIIFLGAYSITKIGKVKGIDSLIFDEKYKTSWIPNFNIIDYIDELINIAKGTVWERRLNQYKIKIERQQN